MMRLIVTLAIVALVVVAYRSIFKNDEPKFIGCFADKFDRAMEVPIGYPISTEDALNAAKAQGYKYVGFQAAKMADSNDPNIIQAWGTNKDTYDKYGKYVPLEGTSGCQTVQSNGRIVGGGFSNAVYRV